MVHGVRRRVLFIVAGVVVVAGICVAFVVFPTRYGCDGDDLTFTTSRAFAERTCGAGVRGLVPPMQVVADLRLGPRLLVAAAVLFVASILLRVASQERIEAAERQASIR
jgi:hypothetical protein